MLEQISNVLVTIDNFVWGIPLIVLILAVGIFLTIRLKGLQITKMPMAIKHIKDNEKTGEHGEVSSFGAHSHAVYKLVYAQRLTDYRAYRKAQDKANSICRADYPLHADRNHNKPNRRHKAIDKLMVYL